MMPTRKELWFPESLMWVCPECREATPSFQWEETEVNCEDCGSHLAVRCPECGEAFDHVWGAAAMEKALGLEVEA